MKTDSEVVAMAVEACRPWEKQPPEFCRDIFKKPFELNQTIYRTPSNSNIISSAFTLAHTHRLILNTMVRLEEVEDETFVEKPEGSKSGALLVDDDDDYTDTGTLLPFTSFISNVL